MVLRRCGRKWDLPVDGAERFYELDLASSVRFLAPHITDGFVVADPDLSKITAYGFGTTNVRTVFPYDLCIVTTALVYRSIAAISSVAIPLFFVTPVANHIGFADCL